MRRGAGDKDVPDATEGAFLVLRHGAACNQVGRGGCRQPAQAKARTIVSGFSGNGEDFHHIRIAGEGLLPAWPGATGQRHCPGIGVSVVCCQEGGAPQCQKLVEGVTHISKAETADSGVPVRHLHGGNLHTKGEVGLVVQSVAWILIHFVTGTDVQHISTLYHTETPGVKGRYRIGPCQTGVIQPPPVLGITDHPDDFPAIVFLRVFLAKDEEIVLVSRVKAAKQRQLYRQVLLGQNLPRLVVGFYGDPVPSVFHPRHEAAIACHQVGTYWPGGVSLIVVISCVIRHHRRRAGSSGVARGEATQHSCEDEKSKKTSHNRLPSFHTLVFSAIIPLYETFFKKL